MKNKHTSTGRPGRSAFQRVLCLLALPAFVFTGVIGPGCGACGEEAFGVLVKRQGPSVAFSRKQNPFVEVQEGHEFNRDDLVRTGLESEATLRFRAGDTVAMGPNSQLRIGHGDPSAPEVTLKLLRGEISVNATGDGFVLVVGDGAEPVRLKRGTMVLSLTGKGLFLSVVGGEGTVERQGRPLTIVTGQGLNLTASGSQIMQMQGAGFALTVGQGAAGDDNAKEDVSSGPDASSDASGLQDALDATGPQQDATDAVDALEVEATGAGDVLSELGTEVLEEADTRAAETSVAPPASSGTLVDPTRKVRLRLSDSSRFVSARAIRSPLAPNTSIKARKGAKIESISGETFSLGRGAAVRWLGAGQGTAGRLNLSAGEVRVVMKRGQALPIVTAKGLSIRVGATGVTGNVSVKRSARNTRVKVRIGFAEVRVGATSVRVRAGQVLTVRDDGSMEGPRNTGSARLVVGEGKRTRIYYDRRPERLGFRWSAGEGEPVVLEVARDEGFSKTVLREPLETKSFTLGSPGAGTYFWRVVRQGTPGPVGSVSLRSDPALGRGAGSVKNKVRDTGRETRIYFQGPHPRLTFSWKKRDGASSYTLRLYRSSNLQSPIIKRTSSSSAVSLPPNRLKEGVYFWYHAAYDAEGKELSTGQMNKLSLSFDNRLPTLRIDSVSGGRVTGVAARGSGLTLNGKRVTTDASGRFSMSYSGRPLVFRIKRANGDRYFVRH